MPRHRLTDHVLIIQGAMLDNGLFAVQAPWGDGVDPTAVLVVPDGIGVVSPISEQGDWPDFVQRD